MWTFQIFVNITTSDANQSQFTQGLYVLTTGNYSTEVDFIVYKASPLLFYDLSGTSNRKQGKWYPFKFFIF